MNSNPVLFSKIDMNEFISWKSAVALQLVLGSSVGTNSLIRQGFIPAQNK